MGKVIARRAAGNSTSIEQMIEAVLKEFPDETERHSIRAAMQSALAETQAMALPMAGGGFSDETVLRLTDVMRRHVGPMASILIKRAARDAKTQDDLVRTASENILDKREREQFLTAVRKIL